MKQAPGAIAIKTAVILTLLFGGLKYHGNLLIIGLKYCGKLSRYLCLPNFLSGLFTAILWYLLQN